MAKKIINGFDIITNVDLSAPVAIPFICCPDWDVLGTEQYALKDVILEDEYPFPEQRPLITKYNDGILRGGNDSMTMEMGIGNYYIQYTYYSNYDVYYTFFHTYYSAMPKYFDDICIYFKANDPFSDTMGAEVQFTLVSGYERAAYEVIAETEVIIVPGAEGDIMQRVSIQIPDDVTISPVGIKVTKGYVNVEIHDIRICSNGVLVPWIEPQAPS